MNRYVIIGSGAAGIAAAESIRTIDDRGEITLVSEDPFGYYSRPGLAYYLTGEITERALFPVTCDDLQSLNLKFAKAAAIRILPAAHRLELSANRFLPYDRLLIATGSRAARSKAPGAELDGVVKLDSLGDARRMLKLCRPGRTAVVVGGGITALEIVEGLRARRLNIHYFLRGERYWNNVLDETESRIIENRMVEEGVHIHYHTELAEILGKSGRVCSVRTKNGRCIPCDIVAVAIGVRPRTELAVASGLAIGRGILVDDRLASSHPDIFAAGDVAEVCDPFTGETSLNTLWRPAVQQGRAAGINMAGGSAFYCHDIPLNVTRLAGLTTTIIGVVGRGEDENLVGIARGDSETWRRLPDAIAAENHFAVNRLRVLVGERTLLGAVVMGDQTFSRMLLNLVTAQADITPIRNQLLNLGDNALDEYPGFRPLPLGDLLLNYWTEWSRDYAVSPARPTQQL